MRANPRLLRRDVIGIVLALVAGLHKAILTSIAVNDDYQHLAYSRQLLAGDLPLRDFWDISTTLQYVVSAASQLLFGHRLLAEAVVVGLFTGIAVFLVFRVVHVATRSLPIAVLCAALFIIAVPRVYAYPKWIVYAAAASLWWGYVWGPSATRAAGLGAWTAVAFYWRHDHGVLMAAGVATAFIAAHGFARDAARRTAVAAVVALALVAPYFVFAAIEVGLIDLARTELVALEDEHGRSRAELRWPLRALGDYFRLEQADKYAPQVTVRWRPDVPPSVRGATLDKYGLTPMGDDGPNAQIVQLSQRSLDSLRTLIDDPLIEDTAGVERGPGRFSWAQWPLWDRARFAWPPLRFTVFGGVERPLAAGIAAAILVHATPLLLALLALPRLRQWLPPTVEPRTLLMFALFAAVVNLGLLREPYESRVADVIVLPVILLGVLVSVLGSPRLPAFGRWPLRIAALLVILLAVKSLAVAGEFVDRIWWLAGEGQSVARAAGAWREVGARLAASPPSEFWGARKGPVSIRLAQYVRRCTAPSDRILVLWFAPEIHFDADRLMAGRYLYYFTSFNDLEGEQAREVQKVMRSAPPLVFANRNNYAAAAEAFPNLIALVERDYTAAATFEEDGDRYSILTRKDAPAVSRDTQTGWPCYVGSN